jgi:membrane-bound ClpP family serine protease
VRPARWDHKGKNIATTEETKIKEAFESHVRTWRPTVVMRQWRWQNQPMESAKAASAEEALQAGLVDFIAKDMNDLLNQLDVEWWK